MELAKEMEAEYSCLENPYAFLPSIVPSFMFPGPNPRSQETYTELLHFFNSDLNLGLGNLFPRLFSVPDLAPQNPSYSRIFQNPEYFSG